MSIFNDEIKLIAADFAITPGIVAISSFLTEPKDKALFGEENRLYIYSENPLSEEIRNEIADRYCESYEIGKCPDDVIDFWHLKTSGKELKLYFRSPMWLMGELRSILVNYEAKSGFTTCKWHNLMHSNAVFDPIEWFEDLKKSSDVPYPEGLRSAILRRNFYRLFGCRNSSFGKLRQAVGKSDHTDACIAVSEILSSYFDILFAFNQTTHPGEHNMPEKAKEMCEKLPEHFEEDIKSLVFSISRNNEETVAMAKILIERLEELIKQDVEKENRHP
ncbi:MAG: hypothetical protein LWY06_14905 [Firmicutes bacterium]|nr:hypothetical protein [Bacillota bacterium]